MPYPAGIIVVHGPTAAPIAARLAMDLRSDGVDAHPLPIQFILDEEWAQGLPGVDGLVIVYDGRTWIHGPVYEALCAIHPHRPVVFVRSRTSRFAPEFERFLVVKLFDDSAFSHYQPVRLSGYRLVVEAFGVPKPARDTRRRGYAFISYSGADKLAVAERLVPALAAIDVGFFDYRFTARLDERKLESEIERNIRRSTLLVLYASSSWPGSAYTLLERKLACRIGRPIVAVLPLSAAAELAFPTTPCPFGNEPGLERDGQALRDAIEAATGKPLSRGTSWR